ncbi:hypothetical protein [Massilia genomosp. 1]|nr:hypothetical protein [Massilia genomosp. 1]
MSAAVTLADGRAMWRSHLGVSSMLWLIANETRADQLRRWLFDVSDRPGGYLDIDIRGLAPHDQEEFWSAAQRALTMLAEKHGPRFLEREHAHGANCLASLLAMRRREVAGEPPLSLSDYAEVLPWDGEKIDLSDLWSDTGGT